ncbi:MAG TPA: GNAT family N-acetyltransferase [Chloroflexota bacterium]|nr:GNAT family N-acetyltransferase [Chloroflexota bacterium]
MPEHQTGLQMLRPDLEGLPALAPVLAALPAEYTLRTYQSGDESGWAALMNTGDMGAWDVETTRRKLTDLPSPQFDVDGLFLLIHSPQQQIVGSACAFLADPAERKQGILHMVCVLPQHRGRRLSYAVCLAVLHRFRQRGIASVRLNTGAHRLGAVKVYLELGFQPIWSRPWHAALWQDVVTTLGWTQPLTPVLDNSEAADADG